MKKWLIALSIAVGLLASGVVLVARTPRRKRLRYGGSFLIALGVTTAAVSTAKAIPRLLAGKMRHGVWWDEGEGSTFDSLDLWLNRAESAGIDNIAIMVDGQTDTPTEWEYTKWTPDGLANFAQVLRRRGIDLTLVAWPKPNPSWIDGMLNGRPGAPSLPELARDIGARAIEFDAEGGNWSSERVSGFGSLDEAGEALHEGLRPYRPRLRVGTTVHGGRMSPSLTLDSDYVAVQAYSHFDNGARPWGHEYGPGNMQRRGAEKVRELDGPALVMGLAAWDQEYPDHTPDEAMRVAYNASESLGAQEVRYWSAKWLLGHRMDQTPYGLPFLRTKA